METDLSLYVGDFGIATFSREWNDPDADQSSCSWQLGADGSWLDGQMNKFMEARWVEGDDVRDLDPFIRESIAGRYPGMCGYRLNHEGKSFEPTIDVLFGGPANE